MGATNLEKKKLVLSLVVPTLIMMYLLATSLNAGIMSSLRSIDRTFISIFPKHTNEYQAEPKVLEPPRFAYLISGSKGDLEKLWRTLHALYHPRNQYVLHLDRESPVTERSELVSRVEKHPIFTQVGNVYAIVKSNMVTYRGPTMVANTLHTCAILLKRSKDWDWFINLSASDYPLVTQDDLIHVFSTINRSLNFIEHTSRLGWKTEKRAMPLIMDPGLYSTTKSDIYWAKPSRPLPTAFKLFTGSAWMVLSRSFVEYLIWGYDNLPRLLLMYYTNFVSSPEGYFHTVICNAPEFAQTAINHDLHYISWDFPPKQHPHLLTLNDTDNMVGSGAAFARKFRQDDPAVDKIDTEIIHRQNGSFTPGGWCSGSPMCSKVGDPNKITPGPGADRLRRLVMKVARLGNHNQCK